MPKMEELAQELETEETVTDETPEEVSEEDVAAQSTEDDAEAASVTEENEPEKAQYDAAYWKGEYYREKKKRQQLQRDHDVFSSPTGVSPTPAQPKEEPFNLENVKTVGDFAKYILSESDKRQEARLSEADKVNRIRTTQAEARRQHEDYDDVLNESVMPLIKQNPRIYELLRELPDPAEAAYTLGMIVRGNASDEASKKKPKVTPEARREAVKELSQNELRPKILKAQRKLSAEPSKKLSADEIMSMSDDDFELEIRRTTGRSGSY